MPDNDNGVTHPRYITWRNLASRYYHVKDTKSGHVTRKYFSFREDAQERADWLNDGVKFRHGYIWIKEDDA